MAYGDKISAQVHRFRDRVAVYVNDGEGKQRTIYLAPKEALALSKALGACARDCKAHGFVSSEFRSVNIAEG